MAPPAASRQLRIAPVMTGGSSLAVWMGGVTAELHRVTRSASAPDDPGVPAAYRTLLELTDTEAIVDVITGTSAGGLNGALLAAAWRHRISVADFCELRDVWLRAGDLAALLRSPNESEPPSLLRGDAYFRAQVHEVLERWRRAAEAAGDRTPTERPPVDLLITVTTIAGGDPQYRDDDFGQRLGEVSHAHHVRFRNDDLDRPGWPGRLATVARASASLPGVFEPSFLKVGGGGATPGPGAEVDPDDLAGLASFGVSRWVVDGGVTVNLPLGEAIDRIFGQTADRQLRRVVAYIKPTPTVPDAAVPDRADQMPSILTSVLTVANAPRAEGISGDVRVIREHNLRVDRQEATRVAVARHGRGALVQRAADLWPSYREVRRVRSVSRMLDLVSAHLPESVRVRQTDIEPLIRDRRGDWLPTVVDELGGGGRVWGWGIAPLEHAGAVLVRLLGRSLDLPGLEPETRRQLGAARMRVHELLDALSSVRDLDVAYWGHRVRLLGEIGRGDPPWTDQVRAWAETAYRDWPGDGHPQSEVLARLRDIGTRLATEAVAGHPHVIAAGRQAAASLAEAGDERVRVELPGDLRAGFDADDEVVAQLNALTDELPAGGVGTLAADARDLAEQFGALVGSSVDETLHRLLALHVVDLTLSGGEVSNQQFLELLQVSWDAPSPLDPGRTPANKLAGPELARLGAFLKPSWRANDWLWGRFDGSASLLLVLLDPHRLLQLRRRPIDVYRVVRSLSIPTNDEVYRRHWNGLRRDVGEELRYLADPSQPAPARLGASARAISFALHTEIAIEELPAVRDAIEVSSRRGAVEGDEGTFRRTYDRLLGGRSQLDPADVPTAVRAMRIGQETAGDEVRGDLFAQTLSQATAVAVNGLGGSRSGLGFLRGLVRPLRTPTRYAHAFVRTATLQSRLGQAATIVALVLSATILALALTGNDPGAAWTAAATVILVTGLLVAALRSGVWSVAPAALLFAVAGLALVGDEVARVITDDTVPETRRAIEADEFLEIGSATVVITDDTGLPITIPLDDARIDVAGSASLVGPGLDGRAAWKTRGFIEGWPPLPPVSVLVTTLLVVVLVVARIRGRAAWPVTVAVLGLGVAAWFLLPMLGKLVLTGSGDATVRSWIIDGAEFLERQQFGVVLAVLVLVGLAIGMGWDRWIVPGLRSFRRSGGAGVGDRTREGA